MRSRGVYFEVPPPIYPILPWPSIPARARPIGPALSTSVAITRGGRVGGQRPTILAFGTDSVYACMLADYACTRLGLNRSAWRAYIRMHVCISPSPSGIRMVVQVRKAQLTHAGGACQVSPFNVLIIIPGHGYRHVFIYMREWEKIVSHAHGPWVSAFGIGHAPPPHTHTHTHTHTHRLCGPVLFGVCLVPLRVASLC